MLQIWVARKFQQRGPCMINNETEVSTMNEEMKLSEERWESGCSLSVRLGIKSHVQKKHRRQKNNFDFTNGLLAFQAFCNTRRTGRKLDCSLVSLCRKIDHFIFLRGLSIVLRRFGPENSFLNKNKRYTSDGKNQSKALKCISDWHEYIIPWPVFQLQSGCSLSVTQGIKSHWRKQSR